ncbi:MAG TPA: PilZ domain-containing protein [Terriglobales bacterium]|nr:PilZ domain-containing protein [Terriglobales bacterium]
MKNKRRHKRIKMVLPVRITAKDGSDNQFDELAHTLDITNCGARLGAIRHPFKPGDKLLLQYRQRKIHFRVVWVRLLEGTTEYQIGVETINQGGETWGLELTSGEATEQRPAEMAVS